MAVDDENSISDEEAATEPTSVGPERCPTAQDGAQAEISSKKKKKKVIKVHKSFDISKTCLFLL